MCEQVHPANRDLIMAADGELPARRKLQVAAHLESCWSCRERMDSVETTIAKFVRARNSELSRELDRGAPGGSGSRALFRARLAEVSRNTVARSISPRGVWEAASAAEVSFCVLTAIVAIFELTMSAEGPKPKASLTPGETRPITIAEICRIPAADAITWAPPETRRKVFSEYGIRANSSNFEVDYLIYRQSRRDRIDPQPLAATLVRSLECPCEGQIAVRGSISWSARETGPANRPT